MALRTWTQLSEEERLLIEHRYLSGKYRSLRVAAEENGLSLSSLANVSRRDNWASKKGILERDSVVHEDRVAIESALVFRRRTIAAYQKGIELLELKLEEMLDDEDTEGYLKVMELLEKTMHGYNQWRRDVKVDGLPAEAFATAGDISDSSDAGLPVRKSLEGGAFREVFGPMLQNVIRRWSEDQRAKNASSKGLVIENPPPPEPQQPPAATPVPPPGPTVPPQAFPNS